MTYDSTQDTKDHIGRVGYYLGDVANELTQRADVHDMSKLQEPERSAFDRLGMLRLSDMKYGSEEYRAALRSEKPFIHHHYEHNSHHPEFYENGIQGMNLLDVIEMLIDWKAASERMEGGGDIASSIEHNQERFGYSDDLKTIFHNTAKHLGWVKEGS